MILGQPDVTILTESSSCVFSLNDFSSVRTMKTTSSVFISQNFQKISNLSLKNKKHIFDYPKNHGIALHRKFKLKNFSRKFLSLLFSCWLLKRIKFDTFEAKCRKHFWEPIKWQSLCYKILTIPTSYIMSTTMLR